MSMIAIEVELLNDEGNKLVYVEHVDAGPNDEDLRDGAPDRFMRDEAIYKAELHATEDTGDSSYAISKWRRA